MSVVGPGPMRPAAVLSPSRMRVREQTERLGRGRWGAAAAARWLRPSWSLRVGFRIAVADQRVVNALATVTTVPAASPGGPVSRMRLFFWAVRLPFAGRLVGRECGSRTADGGRCGVRRLFPRRSV